MNKYIKKIGRFIEKLNDADGNVYMDIWSLIHLLSGVIVSVIMKRYGYNFMSIFLVGNISHLYYEYLDYKKYDVLAENDNRLLKKLVEKMKMRNENVMSWIMPTKGIYNSIWDHLFHIIGLFIGYGMYERLKGMVGIFWVLLILFWLKKLVLEVMFNSLNLKNKEDVKRYVRS